MTIGSSESSLNLGTNLNTVPKSNLINNETGKVSASPLSFPAVAADPALRSVETGSEDSSRSVEVVAVLALEEEVGGEIEKGEGVRWMRCEEIEGAIEAIKLAEV